MFTLWLAAMHILWQESLIRQDVRTLDDTQSTCWFSQSLTETVQYHLMIRK